MDYLDFTHEVSRWSNSVENEKTTCQDEEELNKLFHKSPQFGLAGRVYNKVCRQHITRIIRRIYSGDV